MLAAHFLSRSSLRALGSSLGSPWRKRWASGPSEEQARPGEDLWSPLSPGPQGWAGSELGKLSESPSA